MFISAILDKDREVKSGKALFVYKNKEDVTDCIKALGHNVIKIGKRRFTWIDKKVLWEVMKTHGLCGDYKHGIIHIH